MSEVTKQIGEVGAKQAESFLCKVLGEPGKALGGLFTDQVNARRYRNLIRIVIQSNQAAKDAGLQAGAIPLKIIHPLLENASLEEDPDLATMWANLLANAADPKSSEIVRPLYVTILKELLPGEAKFLNALYDDSIEKRHRVEKSLSEELATMLSQHPVKEYPFGGYTFSSLWSVAESVAVGGSTEVLQRLVDVLVRHGLLQKTIDAEPLRLRRSDLPRTEEQETLHIDITEAFDLTQLAADFLQACRTPRSAHAKA